MSVTNTVSALNGLFKEVYADKLKDLQPDGVMLYNTIPFAPKEKATGNLYHLAVVLGGEHGFSYGGTSGDAFSLNDSVASQVKDAQVQGYEFLLRSRLSYGAIARSMNSKSSFESATKLIVANMLKSFAKRIECMLFYGQSGIGTVSAHAAGVVTITTAEWAPGIWSGSVNMSVELYNETDSASIAVAQVSAVSLESRQITLLGSDDALSGGEQTAVDNAIAAVKTIRVYHKSARGNEFASLYKIMTNAFTLFNISAATYDLWKSVEHSAGGALSFNKIQKAIAKGVEKGLDSDVMCLVNPRAWSDLLNDQAALRMYDQSYKKNELENGAQGVKFHSQNGVVEIKPCNYVKEGHAFILSMDEFQRIGSTDITFKLPGSNDKFFRELEDSAGYELRSYSDQALFCSSPGRQILITGIANS